MVKIGKPSTYPLRTAQRNLNKILLGNEDDLSGECDSQRTSTVVSSQNSTQSAKSLFELDNLISNVFNGTDAYIPTDNNVMEPTNSAIAKDMNNSAMRSITQNSQNSNSALKNDVKLSEYSEFATCFAMQHHPQQMQPTELHSASMSQPSHTQSNTNVNSHLSKIFGDDDTSMLLNNNNHKSMQSSDQSTQGELPSTPQPSRIRNSLISDMVNFSPMNGIMSQDNPSGECAHFLRVIIFSLSLSISFSFVTFVFFESLGETSSIISVQIKKKYENSSIGKWWKLSKRELWLCSR